MCSRETLLCGKMNKAPLHALLIDQIVTRQKKEEIGSSLERYIAAESCRRCVSRSLARRVTGAVGDILTLPAYNELDEPHHNWQLSPMDVALSSNCTIAVQARTISQLRPAEAGGGYPRPIGLQALAGCGVGVRAPGQTRWSPSVAYVGLYQWLAPE